MKSWSAQTGRGTFYNHFPTVQAMFGENSDAAALLKKETGGEVHGVLMYPSRVVAAFEQN